MGRHRRNYVDLELPKGIYCKPLKDGVLFYTIIKGKYFGLGNDLAVATSENSKLVHEREPDKQFVDGSKAWSNEVARMIRAAKKRAEYKNLPFSLARAEVDLLLASNDYRCAVTGYRFSLAREPGLRIRPYLPSIDRLSNGAGYEANNVRIVCAFVNVAINQFGLDMLRDAFRPKRNWLKTRQKL